MKEIIAFPTHLLKKYSSDQAVLYSIKIILELIQDGDLRPAQFEVDALRELLRNYNMRDSSHIETEPDSNPKSTKR